jgi:hypothetical protein
VPTRKYIGVPHIKHEDWLAEGKAKFGEDVSKWKFKCPACGHIQTQNDFYPFKDKGRPRTQWLLSASDVTPEQALQRKASNPAIGRHTEG